MSLDEINYIKDSNKWDCKPIKDLAEVYIGKTPPRKEHEWFSEDEGIKWVSIKDLGNCGLFIEDTSEYLTSDAVSKFNVKIAPKGTVLLSFKLTVGRVAITAEDMVTNEAIAQFIIKDNSILSKLYLYYYLKHFNYNSLGSTSSIAKAINSKIVREIPILLPPIEIQNKISNILYQLDSKIDNLNNINKNLTICIDVNFKNNLLNFNQYSEQELVSSELGLIPKEWEVSNLTNIANYQNGLAMQKFPPENDADCFKVLKIKELRQGFFDETSDSCSKNIKEECIVYDGDVIFSWSGSLLVDIWTGGTCGLNQHLFKVTSSKFDKWFYYCWTKFYLDQFILIAKDKATTMGHIKRKHLDESLVLIPDKETYSKLTMLFKPLFDMLIKNKIEIKKLQNLRDVLMPKLMSGEIDVSKINCDLE